MMAYILAAEMAENVSVKMVVAVRRVPKINTSWCENLESKLVNDSSFRTTSSPLCAVLGVDNLRA